MSCVGLNSEDDELVVEGTCLACVIGCAFDLTPSASYDEQVDFNMDDPKTMEEEREHLQYFFSPFFWWCLTPNPITGWWFGTFFMLPSIGNNHPN